MPAKQAITLKSIGDGISIVLNPAVSFETTVDDLRKKVSDAKEFFEGASTNVAFKGRKLSPEEEARLLEVITSETTMNVTLVPSDSLLPPVIAMPRPKPKKQELVPEPAKEEPTPATPQNINYVASNTAYHNGGLRSGQSIKYPGSVVVLGDVNPGSEIVADGNVIVLGALKGMAHAGASGDTLCFVSALNLLPTQLRIASLITVVPSLTKKEAKEKPKASIAYVKNGKIYVGPLQ